MKINVVLIILMALTLPLAAQNPDEICGIYYNVDPFSKEGSQVEFYKVAKDKYCAKVVWVENPEKVKFLGLVCFYDVTYDADDKEYKCGKVVYPGKNGTFKGFMSVQPDKNLKVRGYWGVSLFGKTLIWKRESKLRPQH